MTPAYGLLVFLCLTMGVIYVSLFKKEISLTYCEVFFTRRGEPSPIKDYFLFLLLRNFSIGRCDAPKSTSEPGDSGPLDVSRGNFRKSSGCISIMRSCLDAKLFAVFRHQPCAMSVGYQDFAGITHGLPCPPCSRKQSLDHGGVAGGGSVSKEDLISN